jgi:hypothetical protein
MTETLQAACVPAGAKKWHWYNVQSDLIQQGGLEDKDIMIDPLSVRKASCGGQYKNMPFFITWAKDTYLLLSSPQQSQELVDAFTKVVDYKPFAQYIDPESKLITTEWDKVDPAGRYQELQTQGKLELTKLLD